MVYACPAESDPRDKLEDYVKDPKYKTIAGLRTEGLQGLIDLVTAEIKRQEPDSKMIFIDREVLSDNGIDFPKDLARYMEGEIVGAAGDAGQGRAGLLLLRGLQADPVLRQDALIRSERSNTLNHFSVTLARRLFCIHDACTAGYLYNDSEADV